MTRTRGCLSRFQKLVKGWCEGRPDGRYTTIMSWRGTLRTRRLSIWVFSSVQHLLTDLIETEHGASVYLYIYLSEELRTLRARSDLKIWIEEKVYIRRRMRWVSHWNAAHHYLADQLLIYFFVSWLLPFVPKYRDMVGSMLQSTIYNIRSSLYCRLIVQRVNLKRGEEL